MSDPDASSSDHHGRPAGRPSGAGEAGGAGQDGAAGASAWVDASSGASGDMLLGALLGAGVPLAVLQAAVDAVSPEPVRLEVEQVRRGGFAAVRCHVVVADSTTHRTWRDVRALLGAADLAPAVRDLALAVFARLAAAEGAVHGHPADEVHFHEVGALDAIADVVGVCAGVVHLGLHPGAHPGGLTVSPVAVGSGTVRSAHGVLPVPPPAVVELLRGAPSYAGPAGAPAQELCTPTGAALLTTLAAGWGPQPPLRVSAVGVGAGGRDPAGHANVLRLLLGDPVDVDPRADGPGGAPGAGDTTTEVVLETNVDDLDPRVWPGVLDALLAAGAADAWLTPVLMKKGRPAHTLSVLVVPARVAAVREVVLRETSAIGLREHPVTKHALPRTLAGVDLDGHRVAVKLSTLDGRVVTAQPEWDDVARAATALGLPARTVLARAAALARDLLD
ncbi:nickel pincer cofactor biosynthesis protein LarC [Nocardioides kribbensis]|uniref:nickel pincer cofactor biosynthesis protein LarC n=1 Tax=Nocardioides kribbensis TaxID=305517 RepID=UPI0032DBF1F6